MGMHSKDIILKEKAPEVYLTHKLPPSGKKYTWIGTHSHFWQKLQRELTVSRLLREVIYYLWRKGKRDKELSLNGYEKVIPVLKKYTYINVSIRTSAKLIHNIYIINAV